MKWTISVSALLTLGGAYLLLLAAPYPLFAYQTAHGRITLYSDRPISPAIQPILGEVETRLAASPINDPDRRLRVFLCNDRSRFVFFANYNFGVGGINYGVINGNTFLRAVNIDDNRLIGRSGREVQGERTLTYFLTHEITHALEAEALGRVAYYLLPEWKREGYADIVGKAGAFDYARNLAEFRRDEADLNPKRSGLYLRFQLLAEHAMETRHLSPRQLLTEPLDQTTLERELLH